MCHFEADLGGAKVCTEAGNMLACQLCPLSPTYWRNEPHHLAHQTAPGTHDPNCPACNPDPWDGRQDPEPPDIDETGWHQDKTPLPEERGLWPRILEDMRCVLCHIPTPWVSPKGSRCHPSCARTWLRARERARRTTEPASPTAPS